MDAATDAFFSHWATVLIRNFTANAAADDAHDDAMDEWKEYKRSYQVALLAWEAERDAHAEALRSRQVAWVQEVRASTCPAPQFLLLNSGQVGRLSTLYSSLTTLSYLSPESAPCSQA